MTDDCPEDRLQEVIGRIDNDPEGAAEQIEDCIRDFPQDARLHFLRGSLHAGAQQYIQAHQSLRRAVGLAPDFAIARFQLGFLQLTSGEVADALDSWGRLDSLPDGHFLKSMVAGLKCMIRDDFDGAVKHMSAGIEANKENPPLNRDMQLIIDKCMTLSGLDTPEDDPEISETSFLLRQQSGLPKKN